MAARKVHREKTKHLKYLQLNILKSVARITKNGGGIKTELGRQCLDALSFQTNPSCSFIKG